MSELIQRRQNTVIALGDLKSAALYFEHVIPVSSVFTFLDTVPMEWWDNPTQTSDGEVIFPETSFDPKILLPDDLRTNSMFHKKFEKLSIKFALLSLKNDVGEPSEDWNADGIWAMSKSDYDGLENSFKGMLRRFISQFKLSRVPLDMSTIKTIDSSYDQSQISLTLSSIKLVDVRNCDWTHIYEFRQDKNAQQALRRLRLFMYEKYQGKPESYIKDDISQRVYDYESSAKKWGLDLAHGTLSSLLDSKVAVAAVASSAAAMMAGAPVVGMSIAAGGGLLEVGRLSLNVASRALEFQRMMREHPASFITYAKKRVEQF